MKIRIFLLALLLLLPFPSFAAAQVEIELSAEKKEISVGESFELVLTIKRLGQGNDFNIGDVPIVGTENFRQLSSSQSTQMNIVNGTAAIVYQLKKTLAAQGEGEYRIGPVRMQGTDGAGQVFDFASNEILIKVNKASLFAAGKKDKTKNSSDGLWSEISHGLLNILVAVIGIAMFLYVRGGRFRDYLDSRILRRKQIEDETAQPETEAIEKPSIDSPDFFLKISALLRTHLMRREKDLSEVMTTGELIARLKENKYYRVSEVSEVLQACDANRYARAEGDRARILELTEKILRY